VTVELTFAKCYQRSIGHRGIYRESEYSSSSIFPHCRTRLGTYYLCTATHCITLQQAGTYCNTLQNKAWDLLFMHCNTLHHTATSWNLLQHTAEQGSGLTIYALQHTASHCNTLQHTATHFNLLQHTAERGLGLNIHALQHTATHCNTLRHTAERGSGTC